MKKFKNFIYYEWKKIVAVIFVILLIAVTINQCNSKVATDLGVLYIGNIKPGDFSKLQSELENANIIDDADTDGRTVINAKEILIPQSEELKMEQQVPQQIQFEVISGENMLYIIDENSVRTNATEMSFADITEVAVKYDIPFESCLKYSDGKIFAIPLTGNKLLETLGIHNEGMYIAQRNYVAKDKNNPLNVNARKGMEYILEKNK